MIALRIVHLAPGFDNTAATSNCLNLLRYLRQVGHHNLVVSEGGEQEADVQEAGLQMLRYHRKARGMWSWFNGERRRLLHELRQWRPDVLHLHQPRFADFAAGLAEDLRVPLVVHTHGVLDESLARQIRNGPARWVLVPHEAARSHAVCRLDFPQDRMALLPYGIDLRRFAESNTAAISANGPICVGTIARFEEPSGLQHLIQALASLRDSHPQLRGLVVGRGPGEEGLRQLVKKLGMAQRIEIVGDARATRPYLQRMDIFTYPHMADTLPLAIIKAMAMGRPVVATGLAGVSELLGDGKHGVLVPVADASALASALAELLADPAHARALGRAGRAAIAAQHNLEVVGATMVDLYRSTLTQSKNSGKLREATHAYRKRLKESGSGAAPVVR